MLRHLCLLAATATASQPQNATRQLDAYAPPATDLEAEAAGLRRVPRGAVGSVHGRGAGDAPALVGAPGGLVGPINFLSM